MTGTNRRHKGTSIFKIPSKKKKDSAEWRTKLLGKILKDREVDGDLKDRIEKDKPIYICEKHFEKDDIDTCKAFNC